MIFGSDKIPYGFPYDVAGFYVNDPLDVIRYELPLEIKVDRPDNVRPSFLIKSDTFLPSSGLKLSLSALIRGLWLFIKITIIMTFSPASDFFQYDLARSIVIVRID